MTGVHTGEKMHTQNTHVKGTASAAGWYRGSFGVSMACPADMHHQQNTSRPSTQAPMKRASPLGLVLALPLCTGSSRAHGQTHGRTMAEL